MRQAHPELLTTLRDVAATAVTLLDTFAQIRRERTTPTPPADASPAPPDDPDDRPDAPTDLDDTPDPWPATPSRPMDVDKLIDDVLRQQLFEDNVRSLAREKLLVQQRAAAREQAASIHQRLLEIADLVSAAIEGDGLRTLPILEAVLERLRDEFSGRTGPFAVPDLELVR
jgi:hypothetical protein